MQSGGRAHAIFDGLPMYAFYAQARVKSSYRAEAIMLAFADREPAIIKYYEQEILSGAGCRSTQIGRAGTHEEVRKMRIIRNSTWHFRS